MRSSPLAVAASLALVAVAYADGEAPVTDLTAAVAAVRAPADAGAAEPADDAAPGTTFETTLSWRSGGTTDYWYRDVDRHGRRSPEVGLAVEMEHPLSADWRLWTQIDSWFDARDARWSSSQTDSIAFVAALRRDVGCGFEAEAGLRYDDWIDLHASKGDPWGPYVMLTWTGSVWGGELSPYVYQELRQFIGGDDHDGTWITEVGAEFEAPIADAWTLELAALGGRVDGSRTDPDVWGVGGKFGVSWAWSDDVSLGVSYEITRASGGDVADRTLGFVVVELKFSF